ncbi:1453_t:CDS:2 [Diversispora eburnea]|uniref:1453_t:CDS:1 n=1 Tax=Diversispora eburnea TaxID=1213867 RepID=A0A9N9B597_9GLOM|nr:1453_t:CDS:2 [Diversispora eburnea]
MTETASLLLSHKKQENGLDFFEIRRAEDPLPGRKFSVLPTDAGPLGSERDAEIHFQNNVL